MLLQILLNTLVSANGVLLAVAGLYLVHLVTRTVHIALSGILVVSTYVVYGSLQHDFSWLTSILFGAIAAASLGVLSQSILRPFVKDKQPLIALLASMSLWMILQALVSIEFGSSGHFLNEHILQTVSIGPAFLPQPALWSLEFGAVVMLLSLFLLYATPLGRVLRAIEQDGASASSLGIREQWVQIFAFVSASLLVFSVGVFSGLNNSISPTMGNQLLFNAFIALLVGGSQNFLGVIMASALLSLIPGIMTGISVGEISIGASWQPVITFAVAAFILYVRPNGILSHPSRTL